MIFSNFRFLLYSHKPEMVLKEDSDEMKRELIRKDELIKRHYEKLGDWQALLQDMQGGSSTGTLTSPCTTTAVSGTAATSNIAPGGGRGPMAVTPGMNIPTPGGGVGGQPPGLVPGNNYRTNLPASPGMQGPLAYLDSMSRK